MHGIAERLRAKDRFASTCLGKNILALLYELFESLGKLAVISPGAAGASHWLRCLCLMWQSWHSATFYSGHLLIVVQVGVVNILVDTCEKGLLGLL